MAQVNIVHLAQRRPHFADLAYQILSKCQFKDFCITICGIEHARGEAENLLQLAQSYGLQAQLLVAPTAHRNYLYKLEQASQMNFPYSVKLDEDIFMSPHAWDGLFNNLHRLNDSDFVIAPALSTGIPTVDFFVENNMDYQDKNKFYSILGKTHVPDLWGAPYGFPRSFLQKNGYEARGYYDAVRKIPHYYKGIHPVRVSLEAHQFLFNWIENNINKFLEPREYKFEQMTQPYLCNSFFAIRTSEWRQILQDQSLFRDDFDEVALNLYKDRHQKKIIVMTNACGVHTMYNTLYADISPGRKEEIKNIELSFYSGFSSKIKVLL